MDKTTALLKFVNEIKKLFGPILGLRNEIEFLEGRINEDLELWVELERDNCKRTPALDLLASLSFDIAEIASGLQILEKTLEGAEQFKPET